MITIDEVGLSRVFSEWERRTRADPTAFASDAAIEATSAEECGAARALYFAELASEIGAAIPSSPQITGIPHVRLREGGAT